MDVLVIGILSLTAVAVLAWSIGKILSGLFRLVLVGIAVYLLFTYASAHRKDICVQAKRLQLTPVANAICGSQGRRH